MSLIAKYLGIVLFMFGLSAQAGFLPKYLFYCSAQGLNNTDVVEVVGGAGVNEVEAAEMTLTKCEEELGLQGCALSQCWTEPVNKH